MLAVQDELMQHVLDCAVMLPDEQCAFVAQQVGNIMHHALTVQEVLHLPQTPDY